MSRPQESKQVWSLEGRYLYPLYSPRGTVEGVLIDVGGTPAQFTFAPHDDDAARAFDAVRAGQQVLVEGTQAPPPRHGAAVHEVYAFERLVAVDGKPHAPQEPVREVNGRVARIHHARHGEPNGVVLDTGDFIHTRPEGYAALRLQPGDAVTAAGPARPLRGAGATGYVIEAHTLNGQPLAGPSPRPQE
ncbi:hypothetical protein [Paracidovorax wautersii]|uniref:DUF5666 domain-containing protein n=1 Tax=Paracidovorax wautersii TaxID=1177982 RepID=A0A1I2GUH4_9BURK|nr:hypothetical protein [Paracidovorax wautersii]SFF20276.1 hypothetical protein SAMN04489711_116102 [Paracidovorax wautersii]